LGTFGFFVGPEGSGLHGNYALSDIVSALEWVKDNIAV
jgi:carboxylesterase type B